MTRSMARFLILFASMVVASVIGGVWGYYDVPVAASSWAYFMNETMNDWFQIVILPLLALLWLRHAKDREVTLGESLEVLVLVLAYLLNRFGQWLGEGSHASDLAFWVWCFIWLAFSHNAVNYFVHGGVLVPSF